MEGNLNKLLDGGLQDLNNSADECSGVVFELFGGVKGCENVIRMVDENQRLFAQDNKKTIPELSQEEETLNLHLDKLKKENFTLQASIKAWQATLRQKLDEFKEADLKLDEIHIEIWSERENFCSKADEFNKEYGILSDWWSTQLKFVSDLENLEQKTTEEQKRREEIEKLEEEIEELKKKISGLQTGQQVADVEVHATPDEDSIYPVREVSMMEEEIQEIQERSDTKKIKYSEEMDRIEVFHENEPTTADLYSIVDLEKLKMINRNKIRKTQFFGNVTKHPTK